MLAGLDPLVVLCEYEIELNLIHNLLWHLGQADRPLLPRILLPTLLVGGCHIGQSPAG